MTNRERNLSILFFVVLGATGLVVGLGSYWEQLSKLDAEFVGLQKRALRVAQTAVLAKLPEKPSLDVKDRFFEPGTLPNPLSLATEAQAALQSAGLAILESKVEETTEASQWVRYMTQGDISSWFRFLQMLREQDPKTLFRTLSLVRKEGYTYSITFEVGHVVLP